MTRLSYMKVFAAGLAITAAIGLAACQNADSNKVQDTTQTQAEQGLRLDEAVAGSWRGDDAYRDVWRNPKETLSFFGLEPGQTVIEISPGGGWYTQILAPYVNTNGGTYIAAVFEESLGERYAAFNQRFADKFADEAAYGKIEMRPLGPTSAPLGDGDVDLILSFRNVHNWMAGNYAEKAFSDFYAALKPGGILGVVEHRLPESAQQDPSAPSGYVQTSYMKALAAEAGFEFVGSSEVNANPKDTADHPFGVWTLPPRSAKPKEGDENYDSFDAEKYKAIGESDRATLKFRKPG